MASPYFVFSVAGLTLTPVIGQTITEISSTQVYFGVESIQEINSTTLSSTWIFQVYRGTSPTALLRLEAAETTGVNINPQEGSFGGGFAYLDTGLTPGTTYYYQISVTDTATGVIQFVPGSGPNGTIQVQTAVALNYNTTLVVSGLTSSSVTITPNSWVPGGNPWDNSTPLDYTGYTYAWYRSTTSGTRGSALSGQTSQSLTDGTVSPATNYYYTASISDGYTTVYSSQIAITTYSAAVVAGAPTLTSFNSSQVVGQIGSVSGGVPPYTYQWQRSTTPGDGTNLSGQTNPTLSDGTVSPDTVYYYRYIATDSDSHSTTSTQFIVTTYPTLTIATPTSSAVTATTATLSDSGASGGSGSGITYQWYRSTIHNFSPNSGNALTGQTSLNIVDSGLTQNTNYFYIIVATDPAGDVAISDVLSIMTAAGPLAIGPLTEVNVSVNSATVAAPGPTGGTPAYTFSWSRSTVPGSIGVTLSFTTQTITDFGADLTPPGLLSDTTYYYTCTVTDSAVPTPNVVNSVQLPVTTAIPDALGAYYASLLIYQYVSQPNASTTVQALAGGLTLPATSTQTSDNVLPLVVQNAFNLPTASGVQLDIIGQYQGVSRSITISTGVVSLSDSDFRTLIQLASANKLSTQTYNGVTVPAQSLAGIDDFLITNFPGTISVIDNTNMTIGYVINSTSIGSTNLLDAIINEDLLPKPMGVEINYIIVNPTVTFFGFSTIVSPTSYTVNALTSPFNTVQAGFVVGPWLDATMSIAV